MPSDAILIDAIDGLYQVIDDPAQWLPWVKRVSDSVRADGGNIALVDLDKPSRSWMVQNYTTEEQLRNYFNNYVFDDYQKQALDKLPTGKVYHTHSFSQAWQERYLDSRYYQEFASATCMRVSLGSYVHRDQHSAVSTGFHRYDLKQPFSDDAAAFIEKLHPHIERVLKFTEYELFLESTLSAVEPETHQGLFLLDRNGRVVFANSAACAIEASGFLKVKNQHLSAQEAKSNQALQKYISESLSMPPQNMHHRDRVVPVARGPELAPLTAIISPHLKKKLSIKSVTRTHRPDCKNYRSKFD
ncbi:MAG: hypothetical protein NXH95_15195 [Pseudomonadaceae bacterium]|nr:hypothetical protein [Pseudomonadaceae bacterium]